MDSLRDRIAELVKERMFGCDIRNGTHFEVADTILALPEIKEALERQVARNLEGRWPDDPRPCEPSQ